jgi:hypothetical protein
MACLDEEFDAQIRAISRTRMRLYSTLGLTRAKAAKRREPSASRHFRKAGDFRAMKAEGKPVS